METLRVIDSHTGGEPTRVVLDGLPDLGPGSIEQHVGRLRREFDRYRTAVIGEPRSPAFSVGAYLLPSDRADFGAIFFNNVGYLGMCGHGTIGVIATISHLGLVKPGELALETPAGIVACELRNDGSVSFENVPAFRRQSGLRIEIPGHGSLSGDLAYGGNWFYITGDHGERIALDNIERLTSLSLSIRSVLDAGGFAEVDHVELVGHSEKADARNFVLCPGGEYDRSPCGTGTCAKLACLYADGKLQPGQVWRQESVTGSIFEGTIRCENGVVRPRITGRAYVNGETAILIRPDDPFGWGIH